MYETLAARSPEGPLRPQGELTRARVDLRDLRATLETDTDHARSLLAKLIGYVTLRADGTRLVAELRGNVPSRLELDNQVGNDGAGSPFLMPPNSTPDRIMLMA